MELAEFLLVRISEDEMEAETVGDHAWLYDGFGCKAMARPDTKLEYADHWAPGRVLTECEAKRRIVKACTWESGERVKVRQGVYETRPVRLPLPDDQDACEAVLRLLALPYADHPDYDEAWKP